MSKTQRLDLALVERGLASTRTKAQDLIKAGKVLCNGELIKKTGATIQAEDQLEILEAENPYVSRGGLKLAAALREWNLDPSGQRCLDLGISTGGFTDCLLQHGAKAVVGIDVGHGQLAPSLRKDDRVTLWEGLNVKNLEADKVGAPFTWVVADLSFISLELVIPKLVPLLVPGALVLLLVKPQFEVGPDYLGSGGIVRDAEARTAAVQRIVNLCEKNGLSDLRVMPSPLLGGDGNQEFLLHARDSRHS